MNKIAEKDDDFKEKAGAVRAVKQRRPTEMVSLLWPFMSFHLLSLKVCKLQHTALSSFKFYNETMRPGFYLSHLLDTGSTFINLNKSTIND